MSSAPYYNPYDNQQSKHRSRSTRWTVGHHTLAWLLILVLLVAAVPTVLYIAHASGLGAVSEVPSQVAQPHTAPVQPADRFMQSIVTEDGALGWKQLCPSIQAQLPIGELIQQADTQRTLMVQQGIRLTAKFVDSSPQRDGGALRNYEVTAHWPTGRTELRTFSVLTQSSGCVEDVTSH